MEKQETQEKTAAEQSVPCTQCTRPVPLWQATVLDDGTVWCDRCVEHFGALAE